MAAALDEHRPDGTGIAEALIQRRLANERARLTAEAGLAGRRVDHFRRPVERPFSRDQRNHTTILFGGLTWKHEILVQGALEGLGYRCEYIPTPDAEAFQVGKEYGNNAQCNPTYFTVGNLVKHLKGLERGGMDREDIVDNYVFFTAGSCGPCRFGMYEAEYRLALENAGFEGFRVLLFQQSEGVDQSDGEAGLDMNLDFFLAILNGLILADLVNEVAHEIRAFEVHEGETDRVLKDCLDDLYLVMKTKRVFDVHQTKLAAWCPRFPRLSAAAATIGKFLDQISSDHFAGALERARDRFDAIEIDRTQAKPIVKITGEFWAQTTEGDGNFGMFSFLHREGAQVLVEPVGTWITYLLHQFIQKSRDTQGLAADERPAPWYHPVARLRQRIRYRKTHGLLKLAEAIFRREYERLRNALGGTAHKLTDQYELQRLGHPYYNSRAGGGEGHLEVAKNIYYQNRDLAHMVLSLKPFGCLPSTQSDGAQAAVTSHYKDMIYLPVETSGEGQINAHSRVQMALGEAKVKATEELQGVLDRAGLTLGEIRTYVSAHPELKRPLCPVPHHKGTIGTAANFALHIADRLAVERRF
jgi:predicted nucleotide-binding protein (sugar kinase/HSP70/actin superfamily)